jgi:hypothetical protein
MLVTQNMHVAFGLTPINNEPLEIVMGKNEKEPDQMHLLVGYEILFKCQELQTWQKQKTLR